jgi:hypothetical protein
MFYDDQMKYDELVWVSISHRKMRTAYKILVGKSEENGPLRRLRRRWEGNIKKYIREMGCSVCELVSSGSC